MVVVHHLYRTKYMEGGSPLLTHCSVIISATDMTAAWEATISRAHEGQICQNAHLTRYNTICHNTLKMMKKVIFSRQIRTDDPWWQPSPTAKHQHPHEGNPEDDKSQTDKKITLSNFDGFVIPGVWKV